MKQPDGGASALSFAAWLAAVPLAAEGSDVVVLASGDRITGEVKKLECKTDRADRRGRPGGGPLCVKGMTLMIRMLVSHRARWFAIGMLSAGLLSGPSAPAAQEPPGPAASDLTREEKELFLLHAEILELREVGIGVTGSRRATLSDGKLTHGAHIQTVDIFKKKFVAGKQTEFNFRDYWGFNVAAYRLDKLLDLNMVPVSVKRKVRGKEASVTWWVDGVMMGGVEYRKGDQQPPDVTRFNDQKTQGWAFQQLVQNRDPNLGNFLIDSKWKAWMLDFTRAFRPWKKLENVEILVRIPRGFYERLRQLDPAAVERELGPYLRKGEVRGLLVRRELLLEHFERLIRERGEAAVLIDRQGL